MLHGCKCLIYVVFAGAPLAESDLIDAEDLKRKITKWVLMQSMDSSNPPKPQDTQYSDAYSADPKSNNTNVNKIQSTVKAEADLYEF